jgi:hypothetical protein
MPELNMVSLAVAPPQLHGSAARADYECRLRQAGADTVVGSTTETLDWLQRELA